MNVIELIITAILVAVAATVVVRYVLRALRAKEPVCGGCEGCAGHSPQGCCAPRQEGRG